MNEISKHVIVLLSLIILLIVLVTPTIIQYNKEYNKLNDLKLQYNQNIINNTEFFDICSDEWNEESCLNELDILEHKKNRKYRLLGI